MKSIEEAAIEYAKKIWPISQIDEWDSNELKLFCKKDFQSGVEFAQRWIPVDEELPVINKGNEFDEKYGWSITVIAKNETSFFVANYNHIGKAWEVKGTVIFKHITHWRPIEYK